MVHPTARTRKRVHAVLRAPDGSAFQKCESCGVSIAIALADMHECESKKELAVKRFRGVCGRQSVVTESQSHTIGDQPRSPFRFFMENFLKTCKSRNLISIDQAGFDIWKNMSKEEREPYIIEAKRVNSSYMKALLGEVNNMQEVNDEADSAMVGKFDRFYEGYEDYENCYSSDSFPSWETEILDTYGVPY
ncbi:high mobility group B protein 7 isoform X3 [Quercus suber]|uniref:high mobility group B protein 7 isoform X3 n=1 Tax=Quercus suber TaxID=58331 RepID=UPI000CE1BDBB|nr:high mobility group B protein 7 isoform X1 [Quercus suber]POF10314.1 high mobility group b protein 7 [Quercus suber]